MSEPPRRIRVVVNGIHAKSGGGVTYLRNVLPELAALPDLDMHLVLHDGQAGLFEGLGEGVRIHLRRFPASFLGEALWEQLALPVLARRLGADVVCSAANYGPVLCRNHVVVLHNALGVLALARGWRQRAYWLALALATGLCLMTARGAVAVSAYARDCLTLGLGAWVTRKVRVVHHGVSPIFMSAPDAPPADGPPTLLAVSDIYVQKNLDVLVRALARLAPVHPDLRLRIAGREVDGECAAGLRRLVSALGLDERVEFLGGVPSERLAALYRECTVFVFPSRVESFGLPLVEAMASGCAIVSSNAAAMPEVLGDAGIAVDPCDPEAMAQAVAGLLDDPAARAGYRRRALARSQEFSWRRSAQATAEVLRAATRCRNG